MIKDKTQIIEKSTTLLEQLKKQFIKNNKSGMITTVQLSNFINENQKSIKLLVLQSFEDGKLMNDMISAEKYYNNKFGKIENCVELYIPARATYTWQSHNGKKEIDTRNGYFHEMTSQNLLRYKNYNKKEFEGVISFDHENSLNNVISFEYLSDELLYAFFDIIKDNRIIPLNNEKLVKKFIDVYKKFVELGIGKDYKTNWHKPQSKNSYSSQPYSVLELLLDSSTSKKTSSDRNDQRKLCFHVNAVGKIVIENRFDSDVFFPRDKCNDGRHLWGLQTNPREQDKKTKESVMLTEDDVTSLNSRLKFITSKSKSNLTYSDFRKSSVEFAEFAEFNENHELHYHIDLEKLSETEFLDKNIFLWLTDSWHNYEDITSTTSEAKSAYSNNVEKFNKLDVDQVLCISKGLKNSNEYSKLLTKTGRIEDVAYAYFFNHSDRYGKKPHSKGPKYLSICDKFSNPLHNQIWSKIVYNHEFKIFDRYASTINALNYSNNFVIENYSVVKVDSTYYYLTSDGDFDQWCNIIGNNPETFHIDMNDSCKKLPYTVMLDHIINNNGKFSLTSLAVKSSMKNYLIRNNKI